MEQFTITPEMVEQATDYLPLAEKVAFAKTYAEVCIERVEMSLQKAQADSTLALPDQYCDDLLQKEMAMARLLLDNYLHQEVPEPFTLADYDRFFATHPLEQLERLKTNSKIKNKVFDLLADYRKVEKLLSTEIYSLKTAHNDAFERLLAGITVLSTPENIEAMSKELQKAVAQLEEAKKANAPAKKATPKKTTEKKDNA